MRAFADGSKEEESTELDLKKNFFYVINPEGRVIDCAKIYSFLHEENIFKRITAKVSKDIDDRINKGSAILCYIYISISTSLRIAWGFKQLINHIWKLTHAYKKILQ